MSVNACSGHNSIVATIFAVAYDSFCCLKIIVLRISICSSLSFLPRTATIHDPSITPQANKKKTIEALATQDATTRYYMAIRYKELYDKELQEVMKKEFGGDLGLALRWLAMPSDQAEAKMIKEAAKGIGSQVNIIWSIMTARTNEEMERLKKTYFDMYTKGQ